MAFNCTRLLTRYPLSSKNPARDLNLFASAREPDSLPYEVPQEDGRRRAAHGVGSHASWFVPLLPPNAR